MKLTNAVYRCDRTCKKTLVTCDQTKKALAVLQASIERESAEKLSSLKKQQDAGGLNVSERMLRSIFGDIK